jgi:hypothetical protein
MLGRLCPSPARRLPRYVLCVGTFQVGHINADASSRRSARQEPVADVCRHVSRLVRPDVRATCPVCGRHSRYVTQHVVVGVAVIVIQSGGNTLCYFIPHFSPTRQASAGSNFCAALFGVPPFTMTRHKKTVGPHCAGRHVNAAMSVSLR